nr:hypothetical protein [Tanacetum cinerariifolium]
MADSENDARKTIVSNLQKELEAEATLANTMFTDRRVEINNLMVLHDHPLIDYGKYALGCMTEEDMKKCVYLKSVRDELLRNKMSRDVITVGSTMRIPLLYQGEYSQWRERFINYLEEQTDGEAMINSFQNGDHPLPVVTQVSLAGTTSNISFDSRGPDDIYSLIDSNKSAKELWDALQRHMLGSEYGEQDRKAYGIMMRQNKNLMDIIIDALYNILKQYQGDVNDAIGYKKKAIVVTSDPLALVAEKQ